MWHVWVRRGVFIVSWWGNRREGEHFVDLGVEGRIILRLISRTGLWVYGLDWASSRRRHVAEACGCGTEPSGSVKCGEFLD